MNPVLTQLPKAQEAYLQSLANNADVDTTATLVMIAGVIQEGIARGSLCSIIHNLDLRVAEKAAIELREIGYHTTTVMSGQAPQGDGSFKQLAGIAVNWCYMPANTRDAYSV